MQAILDHVVIGGSDLGLLVAWWKQQTGVDAARGGVHHGFGTRNALIGAGDRTYVELIAPDPDQPEPAQPRPFGIDSLEPNSIRLCTFVLAVDDIEAAAELVRGCGVEPGPVRAMSRRAGDVELRWKLAIPTDPTLGGALPALIEWGAETPHPGSMLTAEVTVDELEVGLPDPQPVEAALSALGVDVEVSQTATPMIGCRIFASDGRQLQL